MHSHWPTGMWECLFCIWISDIIYFQCLQHPLWSQQCQKSYWEMVRSLEPARFGVAGSVKAVLGRKMPGFKANLVSQPGLKEQACLFLNRWVPGASHLTFQL